MKNNKMIHCESRLERHFVRLLDFDREVIEVESQPVCLLYEYKGRERKYYPDFKVITSDGRVRIVEVKAKSKTQNPEIIIKFIIGRMYCESQGWDYQIVTEEQIFQGHLQENLDKLRAMGYEWTEFNDLVYVLHTLQNTGASTIEMLRSNCSDLDESTFYKCVYKLIYHQKVYADLFASELNEQTIVSIQYGEEN
ncbi:hypothetical protein PCURB6_41140 [Paenibacillus curdlanolyticus]|nr:hypothetical protein PCURB6_41140 [Paenibacillus curdlanolyticus]